MTEPKKEYVGSWIPAHVMEDENLKPVDKILYAEIASFQECFASNAFLAKRVGLSERGLQDALKRLKDTGYVVTTSFNGRTRVLSATQNLRASTTSQREAAPRPNVDIDNSIEKSLDTNTNVLVKTKQKEFDKKSAKLVIQGQQDLDVHNLAMSWTEIYGFTPKSLAAEKVFIKKLIKHYGIGRIDGGIRAAFAIRGQEYAPVITSFKDLWYKWEKLEAFYIRKQQTQTNRSVTITE